MQSPSRRAFLVGRRPERSPWDAFLDHLRRIAQGTVHDFSTEAGCARLVPGHMQDVYHARSLCMEHGVTLALDGIPSAARLEDSPVLWIEPGAAMARCERLGPGDPRWFVQPGCLVGDLEQAGLPQFRDQPPHLTVAAWLADRRGCDWDCGDTAASGLVHALVLLADGTQANLGAFGVDNRKPLDNARIQGLIPRLFELASASAAQGLQADGLWNGRYRLDALHPSAGGTVNLAHLLLGHGGELGWVEWLVFDERIGQPVERSYDLRYGRRADAGRSVGETDLAVRALFDPDGLFPDQGQQFT
ncbi:MAG: hypothetical protein RBR29_03655 [Castellaniella sp.]|uniref:hypothetical protein n=1 Tax=Castellaniella sp. TaxID=1955812 RepID=UPI002A35913B|nr:hypothetical protein [Castellaniella sp.]MDY0308875.1 hypothetical protein [Castellaniella sp.]